MQSHTRFALAPVAFGLAALLAQAPAGAQGYNPNMPPGYVEQGQGGAGMPVGPETAQSADPSSRIATVTDAAGGLSFAPAGSDEWAAIGLNRPVTTGDRVWVDPGGRAELHAGATAIRLGGGTAAGVLNLDDHTTQVKLTQGTLQLRVRALPPDQQVEIDTPNLAFVPREPGDYRLDVSPDGTTTQVSIRHGTAVLYGDTRSIEMSRGQRMRFAGADLSDAGPGNAGGPDSFDQWTAARDAREDESVSARYVPRDMTGYTALDDYGDWQQDPGYGAVWFPRAEPAGWAPYSSGYWAWVAPWGWTWVDDAPWGFAPSHYGRWAYFGNRWGWVPGPIAVRPYYAPAVVGFVGGVSATISIGGGPGWPGIHWARATCIARSIAPARRISRASTTSRSTTTLSPVAIGIAGTTARYLARSLACRRAASWKAGRCRVPVRATSGGICPPARATLARRRWRRSRPA